MNRRTYPESKNTAPPSRQYTYVPIHPARQA